VYILVIYIKNAVFGSKIRVKGKKTGFPKIKTEKTEFGKK